MRGAFAIGLVLLFAGLADNILGFVGIIILTLASGWVLVDLSGKV